MICHFCQHRLLPGLSRLRTVELCAWLDLGLEYDERGILTPVDLATGEVIAFDRWQPWLVENLDRQLAAMDKMRGGRARSQRKPRRRGGPVQAELFGATDTDEGPSPEPGPGPRPMVFSIRPRYVSSILAGTKRYEFRTRRPKVSKGEIFYVYETYPTCKVVASARVKAIVEGSPEEVWAKTAEAGGIEREEFDRYFSGRTRAVAIEMFEVEKLERPWRLPVGMAAPQSWARIKPASR